MAIDRSGLCLHRGDEIRRQDRPTCSGRQQIKILDCVVHGERTIDNPLRGVRCCQCCGDYRAPAEGTIQ